MTSSISDLATFEHRRTYAAAAGRDKWTVRLVNEWVSSVVPALLSKAAAGAVVDVGCAEQPFKPLVEACGRSYVGMDVVQNRSGSVDILSSLETVAAPGVPYPLILCTEVLEHVADIDAAFAGLRRLAAPRGFVALTVPFVFPLHMEPYDFRRLTLHGVERLATDHGFAVVEATPLGRATDVLATLVADLSILPTSRSLASRAKVAVLRAASSAVVRLLDRAWLSRGVAINSNIYATNGVVLTAI
jgi:methyltransferase family protein